MKKGTWVVVFLLLLLGNSFAFAGEQITHPVGKGDTLSKIGAQYGVPWQQIQSANGLTSTTIMLGQKLVIPRGSKPVSVTQVKPDPISTTIQPKAATIADGPYAHVYKREMGKPFAPRSKDGGQDLSGENYYRHRDNLEKHGIEKRAAEGILSEKIKNRVHREVFLPNGTIVESVSFGNNEVWTGGVLIDIQGKPGIKAMEFCGWDGTCILDAFNCGNYVNPRTVRVPKGYTPLTPTESPRPISGGPAPCVNCPDELELDAGVYVWVHDPGGRGKTTGVGGFAEQIWWRNFDSKNCSSQYWWGLGAYESGYMYEAAHAPSEGWGGRLAGQVGLKRSWENDKGLLRQWVLKGRGGIEYSHWENPEENWYLNQIGPVLGGYGEYRHELIRNKLEAYITAEGWIGVGNQSVETNTSWGNVMDRAFASVSAGLDWHFAPKWTWRNYIGFDFEGWSGQLPFVPGSEVRYKHNDYLTLAVGVQAKIYTGATPFTALAYAKAEVNKPLVYKKMRQDKVRPAGIGIGGNGGQPMVEKSTSTLVQATPDAPQTPVCQTGTCGQSAKASKTQVAQLYDGVRPPMER